MTEQFANYKQSLALKELDFNEPCFAKYVNFVSFPDNKTILLLYKDSIFGENYLGKNTDDDINDTIAQDCTAPLKQQVFEWGRTNKILKWPIETWIQPYLSEQPRKYEALYWRRGFEESAGIFETYEEAENALINKIITSIKIVNPVKSVVERRKKNEDKDTLAG